MDGLRLCGAPDVVGPLLESHGAFGMDLSAAIVELGHSLENRSKFQSGKVPLKLEFEDLRYLAGRRQKVSNPALAISLFEALARPDPAIRVEAIEAIVACELTAAVRSVTANEREPSPSLVALRVAPDFQVAHAAARGLVKLTARWPDELSHGRLDPLPVDLAVDELRRHRWHRDWQSWLVVHGKKNRHEWAMEALSSDNAERRLLGAKALLEHPGAADSVDASASRISKPYREESRVELRSLYARILRHSLAPEEFSKLAWTELEKHRRRDDLEVWNLLLELEQSRHDTGESPDRSLITSLVDAIARGGVSESVAAHLYRFLLARFAETMIDSETERALKAAAPDARARLIRFYPANATSERVARLIRFLEEPQADGRFWAVARLRALAGSEFGFDPSEPPSSAQNSGARAQRKTWYEAAYSGKGER